MKLLTDFKDRAVSARQALPAFLLVLGLAPWGGIVMAQQASMEDRLRTQLRSTTQQLQQLQSQQAQLNAAKMAAETERDALRKQIEQLQANLGKAQGQAKALAEEQDAVQAAARSQVASARAQAGKVRTEYEALQQQAASVETQRAALAANLAQRDAQLTQCTAKNAELYAAGKEILAAYESFSTADLLKIRQPFAGAARVHFDEHAQSLGDKLYDGRYVPGAAEPAAN
ncbi:DNA repair protein [Alcaligenes sp. NLF5-7]|uniref:DNA repair protein n=1 Tax=Alcaligenes sp. NLF5-7 TaxID=2918755 RepID=UPI0020C5A845|nr:DNA repair protein [Alcaligenes sp. NLF5-7]UTM01047.1 DNA repair protein [Alcaligenes sp. NLF5-7]